MNLFGVPISGAVPSSPAFTRAVGAILGRSAAPEQSYPWRLLHRLQALTSHGPVKSPVVALHAGYLTGEVLRVCGKAITAGERRALERQTGQFDSLAGPLARMRRDRIKARRRLERRQ